MMHIGFQAKHRLVTVSFTSTGLAMIVQRKIATPGNQFPLITHSKGLSLKPGAT